MELQPFGYLPGFLGGEGLVQGRHSVDVQVVQDHPDHRNLRVGFIHQPAHLLGEILHGTSLGHRHVAPTGQRLTGQEQVAGSLPPVLVVLPLGQSRLRRQRGPGLGQQLGGSLVKADHRPLGVIGFGIEVQDILHMGYEVGAYLGMHHSFFCHGLRAFFSGAAAPSRGTRMTPTPTPPPSLPAGAGSNGHVLPALGCRPGRSGGLRPGPPASGTGSLGPGLAAPQLIQLRQSGA